MPDRTAPGPDATEGSAGRAAAIEPPTAEQLKQVAELPGQLAIGDGNQLAVVDPDGTELEWLDDAAEVLAAQPVWSTDGRRLAWSRTSPAGHELVTMEFDSGEQSVSIAPGSAAFYLQWSAENEALAYLRDDAEGHGVEFGYAVPGAPAQPLVAAVPFYISWSPTGSSLAAHVSGSQVIVLPDLLSVPAAEVGEPLVVLDESGGFTVPTWLDEATLLVSSPDGLSFLDVNSQRTATIVASSSPIRFVVSPDRSKVAYLVPGLEAGVSRVARAQSGPIGGLTVLDLVTGTNSSVTIETPLAWEWSPDSSQLAWLESGLSARQAQTRWHFWDGENTTSALPYRISERERQTVLPFFEQYAHSHSHWSPDGTAFTFAGGSGADDGGGQDSVWVHLVGSDGPLVRVAGGDLVVWSN